MLGTIRQVRLRHGLAGRRRARCGVRSFLLIGTPGAGKRPVGGYLASSLGYAHLDCEDEAVLDELLSSTDEELGRRVAALAEAGRGIVLTWSAGPPEQLEHVRRLQALGFELVWFDSDRGAACRAHFGDVPRLPSFRFVDPFDPDGRFRAVEHVVAELFHGRRRPVPRRIPPGVTVPRVAGGLALAGAVSFGTVALLTGPAGPSSGPRPAAAHAVANASPALPQQGVLVDGRSLAGIHLGDSMATVRSVWGAHFVRCPGSGPMWCYLYPPPADPVGAGVEFVGGKVVAVFTLGSPRGWHTETGIKVGQTMGSSFAGTSAGTTWLSCAGYSAKATRNGADAVTSILTQGASVYGFALTRPSVSPCH